MHIIIPTRICVCVCEVHDTSVSLPIREIVKGKPLLFLDSFVQVNDTNLNAKLNGQMVDEPKHGKG